MTNGHRTTMPSRPPRANLTLAVGLTIGLVSVGMAPVAWMFFSPLAKVKRMGCDAPGQRMAHVCSCSDAAAHLRTSMRPTRVYPCENTRGPCTISQTGQEDLMGGAFCSNAARPGTEA